MIVALGEAADAQRFGAKASRLAYALLAGINVPPAVAISPDSVQAIIRGDKTTLEQLTRCLEETRSSCLGETRSSPLLAVRSSAIGEDAETASFAGTHATVLGVSGVDQLTSAIGTVHASAGAVGAVAYRRGLGIGAAPPMAVIVQDLVAADCAGVMFTRNPLTGVAERVIEVSWGLGEAVVAGLVTPDHIRMRPGGEVVEHTVGDKDVAVTLRPGGGTQETALTTFQAARRCLGLAGFAALDRLAVDCDRVFGDSDHDIEFAFAAAALYLLQRRPITGG